MRLILVASVVAMLSLLAVRAASTPYWDEYDYYQSQTAWVLGEEPAFRHPPVSLLGYSYPYELAEIARFLSLWQVSDSLSPHYGGMREGECCGLENIIETDNTQESIWIWCRFGEITGDTGTYRSNIDAAWEYVETYPAYNEEGTDSPYYRVHNCGWALTAYEIFKKVYADSSRVAYADSCADYILTRKDSLVFDDYNFYGMLHPMVAGWGAGALYRYGISSGSTEYIDTALVLGARVADWVDSNSSYRLSNEVWAMSSGTAMWGVVNSVVTADPPGWNAWLATFAESLQVYQSPSTWNDWNNSWNIWYANAFGDIGKVLADARYLDIHKMLTDTLLVQDTDCDGGVPANSMHPDTMDQTWVSCYLGMMGIGGLADSLPLHDVGPVAFISPSENVVIPVGDSVSVAVTALNYGLSSETGVPLQISGDFSGSELVELPVAMMDTALFSGVWVPSVDSVYELTAYTVLGGDEDFSNDTLTVDITVLPVVTVSGSVKDSITGNGVSAWLYFLRTGPPGDTLWDSTSTDGLGDFSVDLVTGIYDVEIEPAIPYPHKSVLGVSVPKDSVVVVDIELGPATLLVLDDDEGETYEEYYTSVLDTLQVSYICWDAYDKGPFAVSLMSLFAHPIVIWFTGDEITNTLTPADRDSLSSFLDSGGKLFVTGQNIGQDIDTTTFYSDYLHAAFLMPTTNDHIIDGVPGDPIGDGLQVLTAGSPGAGNQISQDIIAPLPGADTVFVYNPVDCAAIKYDSGTYQIVYSGFGFEGVASRPEQGYVTSWYLMRRILYWFDPSIVGMDEVEDTGLLSRGARSWLKTTPNPMRKEGLVSFRALPTGDQDASLSVYDVSGRLVVCLWESSPANGNMAGKIQWGGTDQRGNELPSGIYFIRLTQGKSCLSNKVVILK